MLSTCLNYALALGLWALVYLKHWTPREHEPVCRYRLKRGGVLLKNKIGTWADTQGQCRLDIKTGFPCPILCTFW